MTYQAVSNPFKVDEIEISLFGELRIAVAGREIALPASKKTRALLGFLIATGRPHRRERLCELFWDLPDDPKASLRWALSKLRKVVDTQQKAHIVADRERVFFDPQGVRIDFHEIRALLQNKSFTPALSILEDKARTMEDQLLGGLDNAGVEAFDAWLTAERIDAESTYLDLLHRILTHPDLSPIAGRRWVSVLQAVDPDSARKFDYANIPRTQREVAPPKPIPALRQTGRGAFDASLAEKWQANGHVSTLRNQKIGFCDVSDGTKIAYATVGSGRPIVKAANWLNHLEFDWASPLWSASYAQFARTRTFIRYDERGCGLSDWDSHTLDFEAFVEDLEAVADKLGLEKFPLIGISQGCAVSIEYAARHPERVSGLILISGYAAGWRHVGTPEEKARREAVQRVTELGWGTENPAYRHIYSKTLMPDAAPEQLDWFDEFQRRTASPQNAARLLDAFGHIDVRHRLADIDVPTLVLHSRYDQRIPIDQGRDLAAGIRNAEFVPLESRHHLLVDNEPALQVCSDTIDRFLDEHGI